MKKGKALMRRIGMLTSGGDCQSLNATMRGVAKSLYKMFDDIEIVGFEDGYKGLMYADYRIMKQSDFSGILTRGGTILGTSRQPFKLMRMPDENGLRILDLRRRPDLFRHRIHIKQRHRRQNTVKNKQNRHHANAAASDCHFPPKYRIPSHVSAPPSLLHVL